jgi:hypothetical protein
MNILENIKPCGEMLIWQKTLVTQKEGKKFKRFELSPQLVLKKLCIIFSFAKEKKPKNPP